VAILHKSSRPRRHNAEDDLKSIIVRLWGLLTYYIIITIRNIKSLVTKLGEDILKHFEMNTISKTEEAAATEV
jgi:hypothetical protein